MTWQKLFSTLLVSARHLTRRFAGCRRADEGRSSILIFVAIFAIACNNSPTEPTDQPGVHGRLSGLVTIGPNCPVESTTMPCPTPPSAYTLRKILVYNEQGSQLLHTVDIDTQGLYVIDLAPAKYLVDMKGVGIDRSSDVPKVVEIHANTVTTLNISIDTGLR